jgi:hypothetical protein
MDRRREAEDIWSPVMTTSKKSQIPSSLPLTRKGEGTRNGFVIALTRGMGKSTFYEGVSDDLLDIGSEATLTRNGTGITAKKVKRQGKCCRVLGA